MNTYLIEFIDGHKRQVIGETAGKAKYDLFRDLQDCFNCDFRDFIGFIESCKKLRGFSIKDLFGGRDQFESIKQARGIDFAYQGMRISVCGQMGIIVGGNNSMNLDVVFNGQYHKSPL
ncbi:MAG: hypothetical protein A4E56_00369 [Pelotomaculum sp. PtaU1.Bin065]|nr:MAG: hypothetical protein A4E56_00369 [Pelotomaculum sp. PtaU1.Bin065]